MLVTHHVPVVAQKQKLTVTLTAPAPWATGVVHVTTGDGATVFHDVALPVGQQQVSVVARGFWASIGGTVKVAVRAALGTGEQVALDEKYVVALDAATHVTFDLRD